MANWLSPSRAGYDQLRMKRVRLLTAFVLTALAMLLAPRLVSWVRVAVDDDRPSRSEGTPARGRLAHDHVMPPAGHGYVTYSYLGSALGRQYVHGAVRDTLLAAFADVASATPGRTLQLGESGLRSGGPIRMHRTHQNGLSVDIFMPVADGQARPAQLPTWPWRTFGYGWEFDEQGRLGRLHIDFEELAQLLAAVARQCPRHGLRLRTVIITPEFIPHLLATPTGQRLGAVQGVLTRHPVWFRHDEHVHLDFALTRAEGTP